MRNCSLFRRLYSFLLLFRIELSLFGTQTSIAKLNNISISIAISMLYILLVHLLFKRSLPWHRLLYFLLRLSDLIVIHDLCIIITNILIFLIINALLLTIISSPTLISLSILLFQVLVLQFIYILSINIFIFLLIAADSGLQFLNIHIIVTDKPILSILHFV